jgi:uncharacterized protein
MTWIVLILFFIIILIDVFCYTGIKRTFRLKKKSKSLKVVRIVYWTHTAIFILFALTFIIIQKSSSQPDYIVYRSYFTLTGVFIALYFPKILFAVFLLPDLFLQGVFYIIKVNKGRIRIFSFFGIVIYLAGLIIVLQGIFFGKTNFRTERITLHYKNLPKSFDGFRIGLISDMHLGSFYDSLDVRKGIDQLMKEKPDIIFFTGDLVNNQSEEAEIMLPELKRIHATYGVFSILGNHDMGDYRRWNTIQEKNENFSKLMHIEKEAGFILLSNQSIAVRKDKDSITVVGVDSWGLPPFKKYGKIEQALKGTRKSSFKILLSHNPSHWDAEVAGKINIDLTLSGHTHAMQFGINCCGIFWCPLKWMYPHWAGLYNQGDQYLYVNRGFGYIGFPGRIGMTPEITIIELKKEK